MTPRRATTTRPREPELQVAPPFPISSKPPKRSRGVASRRFGGVTLYAADDDSLDRHTLLAQSAIISACSAIPSSTRTVLRHLVTQHLGAELDDRAFGALLGSVLRTGAIDSIPVASQNDRIYRVLVEQSRLVEFRSKVTTTGTWLIEAGTLSVSEVRYRYYPNLGYGAWTSAQHLLARLALFGAAEYVDTKSFRFPRGLAGA